MDLTIRGLTIDDSAGTSPHERRVEAVETLGRWVQSAPMRNLVAAFEVDWPSGSLLDVLEGLEDISARHWDFRGRDASERWEARPSDLRPDLASLIFDACRKLGLVDETTPLGETYDAAAVLGGGRQTPLVRAGYLAELIDKGLVSTPQIYLLGSPRLLLASERDFTDDYTPMAETEFDLMNAAGERAFALTTFDEQEGAVTDGGDHPYSRWRVRTYASSPTTVTSISAPSSDLSRRPNTADTYAWMVQHGELNPGDRILLVTSAWFTAFQGFDAIRMLDLPHDLHTEIVGFGRDRVPSHVSTAVLLQEVRSGIRSAHQLYLTATAGQR